MRVIDILKEEMVIPELENNAKREILRELSQRLAIREPHVDVDNLVATLLKREDLGTTAIGAGIAIPHGKIGDLNRITAVFGGRLMASQPSCSFFWSHPKIPPECI